MFSCCCCYSVSMFKLLIFCSHQRKQNNDDNDHFVNDNDWTDSAFLNKNKTKKKHLFNSIIINKLHRNQMMMMMMINFIIWLDWKIEFQRFYCHFSMFYCLFSKTLWIKLHCFVLFFLLFFSYCFVLDNSQKYWILWLLLLL